MEYCIHCMAPLNGSAKFCPACGKPQAYECPENHLRPGTLLGGRYLVGAAIGAGGFGITYIARDTRLGNVVAVKEYYPNGLVNRSTTLTTNVSVGSQQRGTFEKGKQKFLAEAQLLATLNDEPGVVDVRDFFEENNTAYIVMEYLRGETLKDHLKTVQRIEYSEAFRLLLPVMRSLRAVHAMGLIHRDISPDNIMLAQNGVKLLDFGAAREVIDEDKSLSIILKRGFAPVEQYTKRNQGPWTDVYALCATMYKCITGAVPTDALLRREEPLKAPSSFGVPMTPAFESVLLRGLAVDAKDRYQSMDALIGAFETALRYPNQAVMGVTERLTPAPDDAVTQGRSVPGNPVAPPTVAAAPQTQTTPLQPVAPWQPPVTPGRPDAVTVASPQSGAQPAVPTKKKNKALAPILVGVVLLVAAVAAICVWYFGSRGNKSDADNVLESVAELDTTGWETYTMENGATVKYNPETAEVIEGDKIQAKDGSWTLWLDFETTKEAYDGDMGDLLAWEGQSGITFSTKTIGAYTYTVLSYQITPELSDALEGTGGGVYMTELGVNAADYGAAFEVVLNSDDADFTAVEEIISTLTVTSGSDWADVPNSVTVPSGTVRLATPLTKYAYSTDSQSQPYVQLRSGPSSDYDVVLTIPNQALDDSNLEKAKLTVYSEPVHDDAQDIDRVLCHYTYDGEDVWGWARTDFLHESYDAAGEALAAANQNATTTEPSTETTTESSSTTSQPSTSPPVQTVSVGDYITFGAYEQDNDTSNGKEPIEWLVLDVQDGKALVISRYALDCRAYHDEWEFISWEKCKLRSWLINTFLADAFSSSEKERILPTTVVAEENPHYSTDVGNDTQDKVFLLSIAEVNQYLETPDARICAPTEYVKEKRAYMEEIEDYVPWLLRTPGETPENAAFVDADGSIDYEGDLVDCRAYVVRPAMWINLE